ncbi:MAG: hypothetical protein BM564_06345 [Bacteroidetes bacterium MedPE-SWsnd-G2]|nr:MAG: hypothetical protein BM564_06345 [Bacteroidetes bacterium MedPE-SWsnd-G2]
MNNFLFKYIDNSALIVFRILFGLLIFLESVGAIFTGWVKRTLIDPDFTFSFIGFEWLQPLPGNWMYLFYAIMGGFGLLVMLGYKYRIGIIGFSIMWAATYFMQKSSYNNHYYLLMLLNGLMILMPANRAYALDSKYNPEIRSDGMPQWCRFILILQMFIVYTYGSIAKIYPDWLDTTVIEILMKNKQHYLIIGEWLQYKPLHYVLAYGGILYDGLIIPMLLWKPTRKYAFMASIGFHLFNSIVFQVGIFPYLALGFSVFFFEPKTIRKLFLRRKKPFANHMVKTPSFSKAMIAVLSVYFIIQIALPLRHWGFKDDVLWTEEGHRMSWRMMLRSKEGYAHYTVVDKANNIRIPIKLSEYLSRKQIRSASGKPDVIWQFAQILKQKFAANGQDVQVFVNCHISVNGKPKKQLIDPKVDLASVPWEPFKHSDWLLPSK